MDVPLAHLPIPTAEVIRISPQGEIEWVSPARVQVVGSWDSAVYVRSRGELDDQGRAARLEVSGNPPKFLQGHNVFGSADMCRLAVSFIEAIATKLDIPFSRFDRKRIADGDFTLSRVDLTYSYSLDSRADVRQWIRAADYKARTRRGKGSLRGNTLYFGQHSRRWSLKFYCKGDELDVHGLPDDFSHSDLIRDFADNLLRCELTLRSMELKKLGLFSGSSWLKKSPFPVWCDYVRRVDMNAQMALPDDISMTLRPTYAATYHRWKDGVDVRQYMKHSQFYVHRAELLKYGIDISVLSDDTTGISNVVPLIRVLEAKPVETPDWAYKLKLVHK